MYKKRNQTGSFSAAMSFTKALQKVSVTFFGPCTGDMFALPLKQKTMTVTYLFKLFLHNKFLQC